MTREFEHPESNPYATPAEHPGDRVSELSPAETDAYLDRKAHKWWEDNIRAGGCLFVFLAGVAVFLMVVMILGYAAGVRFAVVFVLTGFLCGGVGYGMRNLRPWAYLPAVALSALILIWFPCGTVLGAVLLPFLLMRKGRRVFRPDYQDVIQQTGGLPFFSGQVTKRN